MDAHELSQLIDRRVTLLKKLRELSRRQIDAIDSGRMGELMQILSDKQEPLQDLLGVTERLRGAVDDDPERRRWTSEEQRQICRTKQKECEQLHLELLALESESETALQRNRTDIGDQIDRVEAGRAAANRYAGADQISTPGERLDLSSS